MDITLEEIIRNCAINIVYSDENYHKSSFSSEQEKLNGLVRTLLYNAVSQLKDEANDE
jgi:hypothetical protein